MIKAAGSVIVALALSLVTPVSGHAMASAKASLTVSGPGGCGGYTVTASITQLPPGDTQQYGIGWTWSAGSQSGQYVGTGYPTPVAHTWSLSEPTNGEGIHEDLYLFVLNGGVWGKVDESHILVPAQLCVPTATAAPTSKPTAAPSAKPEPTAKPLPLQTAATATAIAATGPTATPQPSASLQPSPSASPSTPLGVSSHSGSATTTSAVAIALGIGVGVAILCSLGAAIWVVRRRPNRVNSGSGDSDRS